MPTNKNTTLKSKTTLTGNKKRLGVIIFAFAAVGAALLIRSFASTVVLSVNYATSFSGNDTNLKVVGSNNTVKSVSEPDGKKTVNYLETSKDGLSYTFKLLPGYYQSCFNVKPTTAGAKAEVSSVLVGSTTAEPISRAITENGGADYTVNKFKETCVTVISRGQDQTLGAIFTPLAGTWRLSGLTVKTLDQTSESVDLASAFTSKDPRFTFDKVTVVTDTVRGKKVLKVDQGGSITIKTTSFKNPLYTSNFLVKAGTADGVATISIGRNQRGGASDYKVGDPNYGLNTGGYIRLWSGTGGLIDVSSVSEADPMWVGLTATKGALYVDEHNIYNSTYGSN